MPSGPSTRITRSSGKKSGVIRALRRGLHTPSWPSEVELLAEAAKNRGRYGQRDALAIRMAARHGLRVSELYELRWEQVDLRAGLIHVTRKKNGVRSTHPLNGDEVRGLRQLRRDWPDGRHVFVFVTERGAVHKIGVR
jgi:type 1 fimbriae regulatory protein FimB